jgi:hypothetical protein
MKAPVRHPDPLIRRSVRVLAMVGELHKHGYQRVRVMPYMAPSGCHWRCEIAPATIFYRNHGAILWDPWVYHSGVDATPREGMGISAKYTSGSAADGTYFGWDDAAADDARTLAAKFIERFPKIAEDGRGWDYAYAGWFQRLLGLAERGFLPIVFWDAPDIPYDRITLSDVRPPEWAATDPAREESIPLPPGGELAQDHSPG